jgi:hypothetical protein
MGDTKRGVYRKFRVTRTDGSSKPGGKHAQCSYFVLDVDCDEFAIPALRAYAKACATKYPALAADLRQIIATRPCSCREAFCGHFGPQTPGDALVEKLLPGEGREGEERRG